MESIEDTDITDTSSVKAAFLKVANRLNADAAKESDASTKSAMTKLASDYQAAGNAVGSGQEPDTSSLESDAESLGEDCG
jgi:hypothetical protein